MDKKDPKFIEVIDGMMYIFNEDNGHMGQLRVLLPSPLTK